MTGMERAIKNAAWVIDDILSADPQVAREMFGDEPDRIASALADEGLLAPSPLREECELIDLPPEPPNDHIVTNSRGNVWIWHAEPDLWVEVDSEFGLVEPWEVIAQSNRGLTVYAPIKEYRR